MIPSRRTLFAAAGAGLAGLAASGNADTAVDRSAADELAARSERANAALMRGDIDRYLELVSLAPDFTLMSPFGAWSTHGESATPQRLQAMGRFFRHGDLTQELVQTYASPDLVVLAVIEHARHVEVGGLPAQDWSLRVTIVYRRDAGHWRLVHRHADPLAQRISLAESAALASGSRPVVRVAGR